MVFELDLPLLLWILQITVTFLLGFFLNYGDFYLDSLFQQFEIRSQTVRHDTRYWQDAVEVRHEKVFQIRRRSHRFSSFQPCDVTGYYVVFTTEKFLFFLSSHTYTVYDWLVNSGTLLLVSSVHFFWITYFTFCISLFGKSIYLSFL